MEAITYQPSDLAKYAGRYLWLVTESGKLIAVTGGVPSVPGVIKAPEKVRYAVILRKVGGHRFIERYSVEQWFLFERTKHIFPEEKPFENWLRFWGELPKPDGWASFHPNSEEE